MKRTLLAAAVCLSLTCPAQSLRDTLQLEAFMDGLVLTHLRDKHIAGATVSIIQDGKILLAKGYGFADDKKQVRVSADSTLFRIGSISKMFTWMSVMQLVSQGKLKLDEDINHYLKDFQIPQTFPGPVTLKDIMTHTPGFEDWVLGLFGKDSSYLKPLGEVLKDQLPARVRPAGTFASYSNHGTGMAAYIVEQVSGLSFNEYVERNILSPLGMTRTSFRQPLPPMLAPLMSKGYAFTKGEMKEKPFEYVPLYPVGAAASTATDMARFMQAILNHGKLGTGQLLDSATLSFMETPAHQHHPSVNPMRYGFLDLSLDGVTIIGHGGDTFYFHSLMALFPESNAGLFISFNTDKGSGTYLAVLDEFVDHFFSGKKQLPPITLSKKYLQKFAGSYRPNRYAYFDITTVASMFNDAEITVIDSTKLKLTQGENVRVLVPIDSTTFREEHGQKVFAFRKNSEGEVTHLFLGQIAILAMDKVSGLASLEFHSIIFAFVVVMQLLVLFYWPLTYWVRRGYQSMEFERVLPSGGKWLGWLNFFLLAVFYLGFVTVVSDIENIAYKVPPILTALLCLPLVCVLLTIVMVVWTLRIWKGMHPIASKVFYSLATVASIAALWQLFYWNLLGFNY